ncbi:diguanylate cyclase domain-containing protein [Aquimonas sp.]|jgi:two-component system CheB/CheR fusion protein|uniref:sensor domain-containing protein n=1 Tax=Aquimonas sp. TaxID=1872588 RepID=UPI0037C01B53
MQLTVLIESMFDKLPCPALVNDESGQVLASNQGLISLIGQDAAHWSGRTMDEFLPPASRIFMQTHVWPMLLRDGCVSELYLKLIGADGARIPVMVNCRKDNSSDEARFYWAFFVAQERSKFEAELVGARNDALGLAKSLAEREKFVKTITDAMPGMVAYWDQDRCCRFANRACMEWLGKSPEQVLVSNMRDVLGERLYALNEPYIKGALSGSVQHFERKLIKADGSTGYVLAHYIPDLDSTCNVIGFFALLMDVSMLKIAEAELQLAASIIQNTIEGIVVHDANWNILSINPAFTAITGYTAGEAVGQTVSNLRSDHHDRTNFAEVSRKLIETGQWEGETWSRRKNGDTFLKRQTITTIRSDIDEPVRYVTVFNDITERWQKDERLRHLALHDPLTDLPNRTLLLERLSQLIGITDRETRGIALLFLDLDGFKEVNDRFGHEAGDQMLHSVAKKLTGLVRHSDTVARLGGDEFLILLDNPASKGEIEQIAERIIEAINQPILVQGNATRVGVSIGIAIHPDDGPSATQLMQSADEAMYLAKSSGKNTLRFSPAVSAL